jgi:hypothetical protein
MTHYDGNDVLVLDDRGVCLRAVDEVRVEDDRAVVMLKAQSLTWNDQAALLGPLTIHSSHDGSLRWGGPVRLVCV